MRFSALYAFGPIFILQWIYQDITLPQALAVCAHLTLLSLVNQMEF